MTSDNIEKRPNKSPENAKKSGEAAELSKEEKLAEQLRANLRRRKAATKTQNVEIRLKK